MNCIYQFIFQRPFTHLSYSRRKEMQGKSMTYPHCGAVEMNHQPLRRIECNGIGIFNSIQPMSKFRTDERTTQRRKIE